MSQFEDAIRDALIGRKVQLPEESIFEGYNRDFPLLAHAEALLAALEGLRDEYGEALGDCMVEAEAAIAQATGEGGAG